MLRGADGPEFDSSYSSGSRYQPRPSGSDSPGHRDRSGREHVTRAGSNRDSTRISLSHHYQQRQEEDSRFQPTIQGNTHHSVLGEQRQESPEPGHPAVSRGLTPIDRSSQSPYQCNQGPALTPHNTPMSTMGSTSGSEVGSVRLHEMVRRSDSRTSRDPHGSSRGGSSARSGGSSGSGGGGNYREQPAEARVSLSIFTPKQTQSSSITSSSRSSSHSQEDSTPSDTAMVLHPTLGQGNRLQSEAQSLCPPSCSPASRPNFDFFLWKPQLLSETALPTGWTSASCTAAGSSCWTLTTTAKSRESSVSLSSTAPALPSEMHHTCWRAEHELVIGIRSAHIFYLGHTNPARTYFSICRRLLPFGP